MHMMTWHILVFKTPDVLQSVAVRGGLAAALCGRAAVHGHDGEVIALAEASSWRGAGGSNSAWRGQRQPGHSQARGSHG